MRSPQLFFSGVALGLVLGCIVAGTCMRAWYVAEARAAATAIVEAHGLAGAIPPMLSEDQRRRLEAAGRGELSEAEMKQLASELYGTP